VVSILGSIIIVNDAINRGNLENVSAADRLIADIAAGIINNFNNIPSQIHHYATNKHSTYTPQMKKIADRYKLDLDGDWNKEALPHQGRHAPEYHNFVLRGMQRASREAGNSTTKFLELFEKYVKEPVRQNPDLMYKRGYP
jgi:hypothetical protein